MTKITAEEIMNLMFLPVTDIKVVEILDALGMNQPSLGEEYEMEGKISTEGKEMSGITICFEALDRNSQNGEPITRQIDFYEEHKVPFPLGLHKNDDYETVIEKIGRKPDFCTKPMPWSKKWVFSFRGKEIGIGINFKKDMKSINNIIVQKFNQEIVEASEFIFPCKDLEK
jgi:hypothetical protein